jgi:hypothetical protein
MNSQDLRFLAADHGFTGTVNGSVCTYQHTKLSISTSQNERDRFQTDLAYPQDRESRISLGTLLSALDVPDPSNPANHEAFLRTNLTKLLNAPREVHDDLLALQFWHAPRWRSDWGRGIKMDSTSIKSKTERLARLRNYFSEKR